MYWVDWWLLYQSFKRSTLLLIIKDFTLNRKQGLTFLQMDLRIRWLLPIIWSKLEYDLTIINFKLSNLHIKVYCSPIYSKSQGLLENLENK